MSRHMLLSSRLIGVVLTAALVTTTWAANAATPKVMVCYYPNWAKDTPGIGKFLPSNISPGLCTHIMFAFTIINSAFQMTYAQPGDAGTVKGILNAVNATSTKVFLSVGGGDYPSALFSKLAGSKALRTTFVKSVVTMLRAQGLQGLDVDWENPGTNGGRPVDKANFVILLRELRAAFVAEANASGRPRLELAAALAVGLDTIALSYDVRGINANLDLLNIMTYDYAGPSFSDVTGNNAPMIDADMTSGYTVETNIMQWIAAGASPSKIALGIPAYAVTWTLKNPLANSGEGAATTGAGKAGPYTATAGALSYYEVEAILATGGKYHYDAASQSFYVVKGNQWISVEKPGLPPAVAKPSDPPIGSIARKAMFIQQQGLGGAMFWEMAQDSFQSMRYPLMSTMQSMLASVAL